MNTKIALLMLFVCYAVVSEMDYQDAVLAKSRLAAVHVADCANP